MRIYKVLCGSVAPHENSLLYGFTVYTHSSDTVVRPRPHAIQHEHAPSEVALGRTVAERGGGVLVERIAARAEERLDCAAAARVDMADATLPYAAKGVVETRVETLMEVGEGEGGDRQRR